MMSIAKVSSGAAASSYYGAEDDYYGEQGRAATLWWGAGTKALGLEGRVDTDTFRGLLDGTLPDGTEMHRGGEGPRRAATDLTFSAPKSVSMQALIGRDSHLIDAHEVAVSRTLEYIERELAAYRATHTGKTESYASGNMVVARFLHDLSRDRDPQLHTHAVVLNMTQREDGQWRALDASALYERQKMLGAYYRAELAREVQHLGYGVRLTNDDGRFELAHITDAQVAAFSSRSHAIAEALAARGKCRESASGYEKELTSLATRQRKGEDIDRAALALDWQAKAADLGIDWHPAKVAALTPAERASIIDGAVTFAIEHLTERQSVVTHAALEGTALGRATGAATLDDIAQALAVRVSSGVLLREGKYFTTEAAQQREREMLAIEQRGRNAFQFGIAEERFAGGGLASSTLNVGQREAAQLIFTSRHLAVAVQGLAGSGKTTMLRHVHRAAGDRWKFVGLAPSAAAARELGKAGIRSETIAAFTARSGAGLDERSLVVVDEAGMVPATDMHAILAAVENAKARLVLVGDIQQLKAVEAGRPFAQLQAAGIPTANMCEIQRQTDATLRAAVEHAASGDVRKSLALLDTRITEIAHAGPRHARIADVYTALSPAQRDTTLIVAGTNAARRAINSQVRQRLGLDGTGMSVMVLERKNLTRAQLKSSVSYAAGDLIEAQRHYASIGLERGDIATVVSSEPGVVTLQRADGESVEWRPTQMPYIAAYQASAREFSVHDKVTFTANDYAVGFINGDTGRVVSLDPEHDGLIVEKSDGGVVSLDAGGPLHIDHGYCTTVHSAQGQTCECVMVDADASSAVANESQYYTAISRARSDVQIYTDDRDMLPEAMGREDNKTAALDLDSKHESLAAEKSPEMEAAAG